MGGNALKNTITRRYQKDEYHEIIIDIQQKLTKIFPHSKCEGIKSYRMKNDHGDADFLLESDFLPSNYCAMLLQEFSPNEWVKNGNCISLEYKEFQVDIILTPSDEFNTSVNYFAWNDLGNLCGRIFHSIGMKLGHDGLSYNWRIGNCQFKNVIIEKDWEKILPIVGLSYERYTEGFDSSEEIFEFVKSSKFFTADIFLLHNRNNVSRTRDRKRKTYMEFLKYINPEGIVYDESIPYTPTDKSGYLPYLFQMVPTFKKLYEQTEIEYKFAIQKKAGYNGNLVMEWTGLSQKPLGEFLQWMTQFNIPLEDTKQFVLLKKAEYELQNI